jgi:hypothetical protein
MSIFPGHEFLNSIIMVSDIKIAYAIGSENVDTTGNSPWSKTLCSSTCLRSAIKVKLQERCSKKVCYLDKLAILRHAKKFGTTIFGQ